MNKYYITLVLNFIYFTFLSQGNVNDLKLNQLSTENELYEYVLDSSPRSGPFLFLKIIVLNEMNETDTLNSLSNGSEIISFLKAQSNKIDTNYFITFLKLICDDKAIEINSKNYYNLNYWKESISIFDINEKIIKKSLKGKGYFIKKYFTSDFVMKKKFYKNGKYETIIKVLFDWKLPVYIDEEEGYPVIEKL